MVGRRKPANPKVWINAEITVDRDRRPTSTSVCLSHPTEVRVRPGFFSDGLGGPSQEFGYSTPLVLGTSWMRGSRLHGGAKGAGGRLEDAFGDVMAVAAIRDEDVYVAQDVDGKGVPEVGDQLAVELADLGRGKFGFEDKIGPPAEIDRATGQGLVHRQRKVAVAANAGPIAQGLPHGLPQADADVLDRVMLIDVQVALGLDHEIKGRMFGQKGEHVVEEADARGDLPAAAAVEIDIEPDIGFRRLTLDGGRARHDQVLQTEQSIRG